MGMGPTPPPPSLSPMYAGYDGTGLGMGMYAGVMGGVSPAPSTFVVDGGGEMAHMGGMGGMGYGGMVVGGVQVNGVTVAHYNPQGAAAAAAR